MKIGIISHPLGRNYGGILQNYALQLVLRKLGHEVVTCDYDGLTLYERAKLKVKSVVLEININAKFATLRRFVEKNINCSRKYHTIPRHFPQTEKLDAIIVGSDQIWRPRYVYNIYHLFLSQFVNQNIRKIAYAASFGTSEWEFTEEQTRKCSYLAKRIPFISVREDSGVDLCRKHLHVDALQVLDPTLLVEKEDYLKVCEKTQEAKWQGDVFCYILDEDDTCKEIINEVCKIKNYKQYVIAPKNSSKCETITRWLQAFNSAKFVVCDSFHGVVFSIIFQKHFIAIANKQRGVSRFTSLLNLFHLSNRLVYTVDELRAVVNERINWDDVETTRRKNIELSEAFLSNALK